MRAHLKYAKYVARHKWFVFRAGLITGAPLWRLIIHDWTKFSKAEWKPYVTFFNISKSDEAKDAFLQAFNHHLHRNPHHWEHWVTASRPSFMDQDKYNPKVFRMPPKLVREMVADWIGAGQAITGRKNNVLWWWVEKKDRILLHPEAKAEVEQILDDIKDRL